MGSFGNSISTLLAFYGRVDGLGASVWPFELLIRTVNAPPSHQSTQYDK